MARSKQGDVKTRAINKETAYGVFEDGGTSKEAAAAGAGRRRRAPGLQIISTEAAAASLHRRSKRARGVADGDSAGWMLATSTFDACSERTAVLSVLGD